MNRRTVSTGFVFVAILAAIIACGFSASTARLTNAFMARDAAGDDPTTVFAPEDTFYLVADLANAVDDTEVKAVWVAVDVDGVDFDTVIDEATLTTGDGRLTFDPSTDSLWPAGNYKVDVYLNDNLARTLEFSVEG
jgi:hypothetical protein